MRRVSKSGIRHESTIGRDAVACAAVAPGAARRDGGSRWREAVPALRCRRPPIGDRRPGGGVVRWFGTAAPWKARKHWASHGRRRRSPPFRPCAASPRPASTAACARSAVRPTPAERARHLAAAGACRRCRNSRPRDGRTSMTASAGSRACIINAKDAGASSAPATSSSPATRSRRRACSSPRRRTAFRTALPTAPGSSART
jgi:hypothetical protein